MKSTALVVAILLSFLLGLAVGHFSPNAIRGEEQPLTEGMSMADEAPDYSARWVPTLINSETQLKEVMESQGWFNSPPIRSIAAIDGSSYLILMCNPYSGITRGHIFLYIVGKSGLRLIAHMAVDYVSYDEIDYRYADNGKLIFTSKSDKSIVYYAVSLKR